MFVHKIFLIASFLFILANSIFAIELNTEVVISRLPGKTQLENDQEMLLLGKEQIIKEYLKLKSLDSEVYFSKVKSMNLSLEKYNEFISKSSQVHTINQTIQKNQSHKRINFSFYT